MSMLGARLSAPPPVQEDFHPFNPPNNPLSIQPINPSSETYHLPHPSQLNRAEEGVYHEDGRVKATTEARERREVAEVVGNRGGERPRRRRRRPCRQGRRSGQKWRKKEREVGNEEPVLRRERERTLVVGDCIGDENGKKKGEAGGWAVLVERTGREGRQGGGVDDEGRRGRSRAAAEEIGRGGRKEKRWSAVDPAIAAVLAMEKEAVAERERWRSRRKSERRGGDAQLKKPWKTREREELVGLKMEEIRILGRRRHWWRR